MTDPTRLLDEGATATELAILRAGESEEPPSHGRQKLSALLGLSAGLSASATAAGSKAAVTSSVKALAAKWLVLSSVGALAGGLAYYAHRDSRPEVHEAKTVASATIEAPKIATEGVETPTPAPVAPIAPPEVREPVGSKAREPTGASEPSAHSSKSIGVEIEELDAARRALRSGAPRDALRALDGYDRAHPGGILAQEAALLRIEALAASGDMANARARAERFLRDNPKTPHRRRISALVGDVQ